MGWQMTGAVAEFLAAAGAFLRAERVRNTVFLTVTETMRVNPAQYHGGDDADPARLNTRDLRHAGIYEAVT